MFEPFGVVVPESHNIYDEALRETRISRQATGSGRVACHPGGHLLVTGCYDGTARIWSLRTYQAIATLLPLPEGGYATLLADGSYKLDGDPGDTLWWAMKLVRFGPGELDPYVPEIRRLPPDAPILPGA